MRDVIFNKQIGFDGDIEATKLELKKTETTQNMSLDKLTELLQQLDKTEATKLAKLDVLTVDDDTMIMPDINNTDPDDHDASKNDL